MKATQRIMLLALFIGFAASARQPSKRFAAKDFVTAEDQTAESQTPSDASPSPEEITIEKEMQTPIDLEKKHETSVRPDQPESRAWTTAVGWHPGASAFPDGISHEPRLVLFSFPIGSR